MKNLPTIKIPEGALQIESKISKTEIINLVIESIEDEITSNFDSIENQIIEQTTKFKEAIKSSYQSLFKEYQKFAEDQLKFLSKINRSIQHRDRYYDHDLNQYCPFNEKYILNIRLYITPQNFNKIKNQSFELASISFRTSIEAVNDFEFDITLEDLNKTQKKIFNSLVNLLTEREEILQNKNRFQKQKNTAKNAIISSILSSSEDGRVILDSIAALKAQAMKQLKAS